MTTNFDDTNNYELSDNGVCPKYCKLGKESGICVACNDNCFLLGSKTRTEVICLPKNELTNAYCNEISNPNIYYRCIVNCTSCTGQSTCTEWASGYAFKGNDRSKCYPKTDFDNYYFTEDQGIRYQSCENKHCKKCSRNNGKIKYNLCDDGFYILSDRIICQYFKSYFGE